MCYDNDNKDSPISYRDTLLKNLYDIEIINNDIEDRFLASGPVKTLSDGVDELYVHIADAAYTMLSDGARLQSDMAAGDGRARPRERALCLRARNYSRRERSRGTPSGAWRAIRASVVNAAASYHLRA